MKRFGKEFMVGGLVLLAVGGMLVFGWLMGVLGPFTREAKFAIYYSFAGGVEVGSPVRVSGVKVGKVESIEFLPDLIKTPPVVSVPRKEGGSESGADATQHGATLRVTISVAQKALPAVRQDSRFYVNMAGIIGERYIEISPGSKEGAPLVDGSTVRGVDPPRVDQLLSQGYGVFGRIQDFLDENERTVTEFLGNLNSLMKDANQMLKGREKQKFFALVENLNAITTDLRAVTGRFQDPETKRLFERLTDLVERAHQIDKATLKKFLQEEGVRARVF